ncbi:hypothetical protein NKG94_34385 [Micromonospora sp. M12]
MLSYSPRQIDRYGRYLPAPVAIRAEVADARGLRLPGGWSPTGSAAEWWCGLTRRRAGQPAPR